MSPVSISELGELPRWDLSNIYQGLQSDDFREGVERLQDLIQDLEAYMDKHRIAGAGFVPANGKDLACIINGYLDRSNALHRLNRTIIAFVYSFITTDSYNKIAARTLSEVELLGVRLRQQEVRFQSWLGLVTKDSDILDQAIMEGGSLADHAFYLQETAEQSRYLMTEKEETLASELSLSGGVAWSKLQGVVTSQTTAAFERDGQSETLPITVIQTLYSDPDPDVRRRAYEVELKAWEAVREPLAACMNGVKGTVITLDKRRGRLDPLHQTLDMCRMDRDTLEALLTAMRASFPAFRQYWQAKARRLGKDKLPWWDLYAPVGRQTKLYTFPEARDFILENFATFSVRLADFAERAFDNSWFDAEPREGKRGGAFCMLLPAVEESRILCNYDGTLDQVATIAHELGHAYHNECAAGKTPLQRQTPMTLSETASIFNQTIITNAALAGLDDPAEELAILESFLIDSSQVIVDIYSRYLLESEVFKRRGEAELSADELCAIMIACQQETYGDGLDERYLHPYMWAWKPHYYSTNRSFYNFPYAFGLLFGLGLYKIYQNGKSDFVDAYDEFLRSTGEAPPAQLASRFNIDLPEPVFWEEGIELIKDRIDRYLEII